MEDGLIVEAEAGREGNAPLDRPAYLGDALAEIAILASRAFSTSPARLEASRRSGCGLRGAG